MNEVKTVDPYMSDYITYPRWLSEWRAYGDKFVIAYDFDDTVFDYHNKGYTYENVIGLLRECKEYGAHLVVFTGNPDSKYPQIREYLESNNIPYDAINESPEWIPLAPARKIYYNIFLDDRAGLKYTYDALRLILQTLVKERNDGAI